MAVKAAEEGEAIIVRLYERFGRDCSGHLEFSSRLMEAQEVNGLEERAGDAVFEGNTLQIALPANGMRSYRVMLPVQKPGRVVARSQLSLPVNEKLISANGEKDAGIFPAELVPETIESGPIQYHLAREKEKDALSCSGQSIDVPREHSFLYILAGAVEDCAASITWLNEAGRHSPSPNSMFLP